MTNEERQRQMDFILAAQAKLHADVQQLSTVVQQMRESQSESIKRVGSLERGFVSLFNAIQDVAKAQRENATQIATLVEAQKETNERLKETDERLKETDERLNAFIVVVERSISERANGNGSSAAGKKRATKKRQSRK